MTYGFMRKLPTTSSSFLRLKNYVLNPRRFPASVVARLPLRQPLPSIPYRSLAQLRHEPFSELWFTSSSPVRSPADDLGANGSGPGNKNRKPPDERTLKLGKTLRELSPLLPNILTTPLPPELLSPHITLHLFPSTHPHLPAVKGRVPYKAALWTAPVAWGCVPIVGNVKLKILSERVVRSGFVTAPQEQTNQGDEKLVVRWKSERKRNGSSSPPSSSQPEAASASAESNGINKGISGLLGGNAPIFKLDNDDDFTGLFIFSFDEEGRVASHTIEHADENTGWDRTAKVVSLTDWLLGKAKWGRAKDGDLGIPGLAMRWCQDEGGGRKARDERPRRR